MITIKCGKLFVEKYNEENGTNLSPKEIFSMLAEKAFKYDEASSSGKLRLMTFFSHTPFGTSNGTYYCNFNKNKSEKPSFDEALNDFCDDLENINCGVEVEKNVYGGCGMNGNKGFTMSTTEFNYCDNIHFTIDERYCSFIGSFFQILVDGFATTIDDKDIIWMMYKSFNEYWDFIHGNEDVKDKQLPTWNGCYFYETVMNKRGYTMSKYEDGFSTISFLEFLEAISKLTDKKIDVLTFENFGQTNKTCGYITIDLEGLSGWFKIFRSILTNIDEEFDIKKYADIFGKNNLLFLAMENGEVTNDMLNPIVDFKKRMTNREFKNKSGIKFLKEYLKLIMSKKEMDMAKDFANFLKESSKSSRLNVSCEVENIFKYSNAIRFAENIMAFCEKSGADKKEASEVVEYFMEDGNQGKLREFLVFTKFNI